MRKPIVIAVAAALAGCWQVGPDYVKPKIDTPKQWRFADKEARDTTNLKWWEQLGDPELNRLVDQALRGNLDLKVAVANVDQFMGQYGATRANLFPQISGFGDYLRRKSSTQSLSLPKGIDLSGKDVDYARLGGQLSWEIDVWGALRRANEAAFAQMLAQEGVKRGVLLTLASQVAQTYIQLRTLDKNLDITRFVVKTLEEQLQIENARFKEGYGSELEVRQVESEYQRRLALIPAAEENIAQTEHALKLLLGQNPGAIRRGKSLDDLKLPAVPAGLPADVLVRRPDIQQAEQQLIAANAQIGVARGLYFPKISITSDVGQLSTQAATMFTPGANFWSVGTSMLGPIFTAGKIAGQVQAAEATQRAALANYQQSILTAFREFEDALVASQKTQEQRDKQGARVTAVGDYYRLSKLRYDEGLVDYITVLDSLRQLYEAQIDLLSAQSSTFTASIQLYRAMGGGWVVAEAEKLPKPQEPSVFP
ncbi:outer membrane protein, multidrug efflux system [Methylomagnum ishizawai]|uniref:Outer membrane protein, multidrug efflux system n=1 Tax=Methylomagnum ishizawai TaxID=1760988 RepID=A0A1Y6D287_9GAMM|nr:efflux transporter outer membrane subunit [Methylomagnum ishizawai]SMF96747.1 outer membrane protein, multidrug efflux system [Methylomagnum ishizawai]